PLFGWDQFADGDPTEYAAGETIDVRLLPATGSGMVDLSAAATDQVTFSQRALRPYPPGNFKIENIAYPEGPLVLSAATGVSWSHRDRTQQTSGVFEDTSDLDIGPEPGTTYTVQVYDHQDNLIAESAGVDGTDTAVDTSAAITAKVLRFVLFSVRAGLESWQRHEWVVDQGLDLWTPAEITTALWLDAADTDTFTLVSGAVSEWRDKSGNARHATQSTAGNRPTRPGGQLNSLPVVRFDGTDDRMNLPALGVSGSDNRTFIAVATMTDPGSYTRLLFHQGGNGTETSSTGDAWRVTLDGGTKNLRIGVHDGGYTSAFNAVGTAIWGVLFEGTTLADNALYKNGVSEQATGTTSINTVDANNRIADIPGTTGKYMSGDVAEIVFIASAIDTPTRERIEGYLAWKWGLVSLLPSEHPYKVVPPVLD
ncbi:MAG TPA: hypothetical protein PKZ27_15010, partial [Rhodocyclaceae bacterium]|nr:hypothetical protein [Rhodocyclaceae bacterium]